MKKYIVKNELPDANVGTEVIWDDDIGCYFYKKNHIILDEDNAYLTKEQVQENNEFFCEADHYPEFYGFNYPVFSRKDVLDIFNTVFYNLNCNINKQQYEFEKLLRSEAKNIAEKIINKKE